MRFFFLFVSLVFISFTPLHAALAVPAPQASSVAAPADLSRQAVEARLGRKLRFTERIALGMMRKKMKNQARKQARRVSNDGRITDVPSLLSMIFGIVGFLFIWVNPFAGLFSIAALVLGIIGLGRVKRDSGYRKGKGFAVAGIALGGTFIFLLLLAVAILLIVFT